jgi:hypothetical protein
MSLPPDDSMLAAKIQVILQEKPGEAEAPHVNAYAYANERYLVALVLLTRLRDVDLYVTVWNSHPELVSFCIGLLRDPALEPVEDSGDGEWHS